MSKVEEVLGSVAEALGNIVGDFQGAFDNVAMSVPIAGGRAEPATAATPASVVARPQSITVPVTVTLDGVVIARTVKKILLEQRQMSERSIGRLT
jgi:hypothetical protein